MKKFGVGWKGTAPKARRLQAEDRYIQWATQRLKDYLVQGYAINSELLSKQGQKIIELKNQLDILRERTRKKASSPQEKLIYAVADAEIAPNKKSKPIAISKQFFRTILYSSFLTCRFGQKSLWPPAKRNVTH
ncbi:MAG: hypothetical protein ACXIT9_12855 [Nitritalea sp.]